MKIIHIQQRHKPAFNIQATKELKESIYYSQFLVANTIKKYPQIPVLVECLYEDSSYTPSSPMSFAAKIIFPEGFPNNFDKLTTLQKKFLYEQGGADTLFHLGEINALFKSIHKEISEKIDFEIAKGKDMMIYEPREIEAIKSAKEAAMKHFGKLENSTVIIVYGQKHNFRPYCKKEGFELETVDAVSALQKIRLPLIEMGLDLLRSDKCEEKETSVHFMVNSGMSVTSTNIDLNNTLPHDFKSQPAATNQSSLEKGNESKNKPTFVVPKLFNPVSSTDIEEITTTINIGNLSLRINKSAFPSYEYSLEVVQNGKMKINMFYSKKGIHEIIKATETGTPSLINYLNGKGESTQEIAELVKTQISCSPEIITESGDHSVAQVM